MDDAYITFRCAQNLANGDGLVFNPGEPVEASSNFAYAVAIGAFHKIGVDPAIAALILNALGLLFILHLLIHDAGIVDAASMKNPARWLGLVFGVAAQPAFWIYTHSGMETVAYTALLFAGFLALIRAGEGRASHIWAAVWIGTAATIRMEAAAFIAPACAFLAMTGGRNGRWLRVIAALTIFAAVFVPVCVYRYRFYGFIFPNTYYAKVDGGSAALALRGALYVALWFAVSFPAVPMLAGAFRAVGKHSGIERDRLALGLVWVGGYIAYNVFVGGDYFPFGRFFVPVLPVLAWMTPRALDFVPRKPIDSGDAGVRLGFYRRAIRWCVAGLILTIVVPTNGLKYYSQMELVDAWGRIGKALKRRVPKESTLFLAPAGAMPYFSGLRSYDSLGLTDASAAHRNVELGRGVPGHEKTDFSRIRALKPDLVFFLVDSPGVMVDVLLLEYFEARRRFAEGAPDPAAEPEKPTWFAERHDAMGDFLFSSTMLADYDLMELIRFRDRALFFVKKESPASVREAFIPVVRPSEKRIEAQKGSRFWQNLIRDRLGQ